MKRVFLELDGDLATGVRVTLEIYPKPQSEPLKIKGKLPPNPNLAQCLQSHWQEKYRTLGAPYRWQWRITPKKVINRGSIQQKIKDCQESAEELCRGLEEWLESEPFRPVDRRLREQLDPSEDIRFLIRTDNLQLRKLPWQEWNIFESYSQIEPSFCPLESQPLGFSPSVKKQIKILVILGHDQGIETQKDQQLLAELPHADPVFLVKPQRREITEQLWEQSWDIIFFAGHSETQGETGVIYINPDEYLTIDELWFGLKKACDRGLQLAIFNSCDGLGLSRRLDDLQIPQMIVMRELVPDQVAQRFLRYFLTNFAQGQSFYLSVREARQRLHDEMEDQFPCASWLPVICQNPSAVPPVWVTETPPTPSPEPIKPRKRIEWGLLFFSVLAMVLGGMGLRSLGLLQRWEWKAYDQLVRLRPQEGLEDRIVIVEITDRDVDLFPPKQPGSIDDDTLYQLLQKIMDANPRQVGLTLWRDGEFDLKLPQLIQYIQNHENIYGICSVGKGKYDGLPPSKAFPKGRYGFDDIFSDDDDVVRRHVLFGNPPPDNRCQAKQSYSSQLAIAYLQKEQIQTQFNEQGQWEIDGEIIPPLKAPKSVYQKTSTKSYQTLLNYRSHGSPSEIVESVSVADILSDRVKPELLRDKLILIGLNHSSTKTFMTPYGVSIPGVYLEAQNISQLLNYALENRPLLQFIPFWVEGLLISTTALFYGLLIQCFRSRFTQVLITLTLIFFIIAMSSSLLIYGYWLPFIPWLFVSLGTGVIYGVKRISFK